MKVLHVAGARPNFMKVAPVARALRAGGAETMLVHTGQHYDRSMSSTFFDDLGLPEPDVRLDVGSGSHASQTARVMERLEPVLLEHQPDLVVVVGDVNSTMAAALVCAKLLVPVAHVEAGLRSFDRSMPEEINRIVTDQVSELLFTTSPEAEPNLVREGIARERIHFVGNPMIDSLEKHLEDARASSILSALELEADGAGYAVLTMHRPSNVDHPGTLRALLEAMRDVAASVPIVFPAHPRTVKMVRAFGLQDMLDTSGVAARARIACIDPLGYQDFLRLMAGARLVFTDSGGIQEETTILGVPCVTLRENTERPITVELGTNRLVGADPDAIRRATLSILNAPRPAPVRPPLWDGDAGGRIAEVILGWGSPLAGGAVRGVATSSG